MKVVRKLKPPSVLKARRTMLQSKLEEFEARERRVVNHTPRGDAWAADRIDILKHGIARLTQVLADTYGINTESVPALTRADKRRRANLAADRRDASLALKEARITAGILIRAARRAISLTD